MAVNRYICYLVKENRRTIAYCLYRDDGRALLLEAIVREQGTPPERHRYAVA